MFSPGRANAEEFNTPGHVLKTDMWAIKVEVISRIDSSMKILLKRCQTKTNAKSLPMGTSSLS